MQGICGFLNLDGQPADPATLANMREALVRTAWSTGQNWHAGAIGFAGVHWAAGERSHLPALMLRDRASGCTVVADARLQDRTTLAASLDLAPDAARDATDAALILSAWQRWGRDCVQRLEGDFAFAVHDPRREALFLARDRMGVRPLYMHLAPGRRIVFASSTRALLSHPLVPATLDEGRIADFLVTQLEGIDHVSTFHAAIQRLPPAHWLALGNGASPPQRYWALQLASATQLPETDGAWADALTEALERAVAAHVDGIDRVGCMVSGGLDSSSIAIIASQQLAAAGRGPLATFSSIDSRDPDCAETRAIRAVLRMPGLRPTLVDHAALAGLQARLRDCLDASDEPFDGSMALLHAQYMAAADARIDALMDGLDGDSLLLEGSGVLRQLRRGHWRAAWHNQRGLERIHGHEAAPAWRTFAGAVRSALIPRWLRQGTGTLQSVLRARRNIAASLIAPEFARRIGLRERLDHFSALRSARPLASAPLEALEALRHPYPTVGMERYHRVAALHGVQPRHPLVDRRLLELCVNLPDRQRFDRGWSKAILRRAMQSRLPDEVCWRTGKQHLGWGLSRQLLDSGRNGLSQHLRGLRPLLDPYIDSSRLDVALARVGQPGDDEALQACLEALALGRWLKRSV